ncbi:NADH:flavin oxidoreductase/NADH oxidase family protein [Primorskyibacter sp. S87]|uniref:NADH:flavin oxidoreductase/NADH oxidase family protein n=1 Tax=Primorskyibacter sp. S87 TaxID=3415126 RepID=UPI003C7C0CA8
MLFEPLSLPCGVVLNNRIAKSAMSDSLGDGTGHPTTEQFRLYRRWAEGGVALSIIGEVQGDPGFAEKPGNLVLNQAADLDRFKELARHGAGGGAQLWLQLGHAGALAYEPTSTPKGPSALDLPGLRCEKMERDEIERLPEGFAATARMAQQAGFGGVQVHAAHGFLLSQFLSPLFNQRRDDFGGPIENRMRPLIDTIGAIRAAVGPGFPIGVKLNSSDQLEGGFSESDALKVVSALEMSSVDLIDISGGTYFPGAKSASDGAGRGPYFLEFAKHARTLTTKPLMLTGGFKTRAQAENAIAYGSIDVVGLARALVLEPSLPELWRADQLAKPAFPRFSETPEGGITAWYTMRIADLAEDHSTPDFRDVFAAIKAYGARDQHRTEIWLSHFS